MDASVKTLLTFLCHGWVILAFGVPGVVAAQPKPVPRMQAVPLADHQVSFQQDGKELTAYHFGSQHRRPFLFPVIGPSGRSITRMGHPHDPVSHSHHNSIWVSHHDLNGVNFWGDPHTKGNGRIAHQRVEKLFDDDEFAAVQVLNHWIEEPSQKVIAVERRRIEVRPLPHGEFWILLDLRFECKQDVTFGKSSFGLVAVRMAKSIGVNDGGGTIRNSSGAINEKEVFWKPTKWVDYSGAITNKAVEGATLMDHPSNPQHPSVYHVRNDGWMGNSLSFHEPIKLTPANPLELRYGVYVHSGMPATEVLNARWEEFAKLPKADLSGKKK